MKTILLTFLLLTSSLHIKEDKKINCSVIAAGKNITLRCEDDIIEITYEQWPQVWGDGPHSGYDKYPANMTEEEIIPIPLTEKQKYELQKIREAIYRRSNCLALPSVGCF